jgi:hypothetical protein
LGRSFRPHGGGPDHPDSSPGAARRGPDRPPHPLADRPQGGALHDLRRQAGARQLTLARFDDSRSNPTWWSI